MKSRDRNSSYASVSTALAASPVTSAELAGLAGLICAAAFLRFHALGAKSLWIDEGVSVAIARMDWYNFARLLWRREANMSLYYVVLRPWLHLGSSEAFVRSLSVIFGLAVLPVLYLLGRRLFDERTGWIAAALLTVNAYHVRYSQEARSYTLMFLLCALSSLYFVKYLDSHSRKDRIGYEIFSILAAYAHFFSGLVVLAQWLSLQFLERARIPFQVKKAQRRITLGVLPIAIFVATTGAGPLRWITRPGLKDLWKFAIQLSGNGGPALLIATAVFGTAGLLLGLRELGAREPGPGEAGAHRLDWREWRYVFLLLWFFSPPLLVLAASWIRPLFMPRYFTGCLPALLLLAAAGLARFRPRWAFAPAVLLFLVLSLYGTASYYKRDFDTDRGNWREASNYLLTNARPGDALLFSNAITRTPYEYYRSRRGASPMDPVVLYPRHGDSITYLDFLEKPQYQEIARSLPLHGRVWLVIASPGSDPIALPMERMLNPAYANVQLDSFVGPALLLYAR